jgi:hypothetical protein
MCEDVNWIPLNEDRIQWQAIKGGEFTDQLSNYHAAWSWVSNPHFLRRTGKFPNISDTLQCHATYLYEIQWRSGSGC